MWKTFRGGTPKNCPAMGKTCEKCNKPNHLARINRSQQINKVTEKTSSSDEECNFIRCFDSCDDFEIMAIEKDKMFVEQIADFISDRLNKKTDQITGSRDLQNVKKVGTRRNLRSAQTTKQILEECLNTKLMPAKSLNLSAQFVDYNKQPILILGALKADIRSAGWEVKRVLFLVTERRTRCILGFDFQSKIGIHTTQKTAPTDKFRFDVLLCEESQGLKKLNFRTFLTARAVQKIM